MSTLGDLPPDQARLWMHRLAGWVADYREKIEQRRITPGVAPGALGEALTAIPPEHGQPLAAIFEDFERTVMPEIVHSGHPRFFGDGGSVTTAPGLLGAWLAAALDLCSMTPTSQAAIELETAVLDWIRGTLGLPETFAGVAYDTPGMATLHVLEAAREATGLDVRRRGMAGTPPLAIYASAQADGAVEQAAAVLGLGEKCVRRIETDGEYRMRPTALRAAVARDVHARLRPVAVVATVGTRSNAAVDPVPAVADVCREHGLWLHVDATCGAATAVLPEGRRVLDGVGRADSVLVSPREWLFVPLAFSALYTPRPEMLRAVLPVGSAERRADADDERSNVDIVQPGRRSRALEAWMVFRAFGRAGLETRIRERIRLARRFAEWVEADHDFELAAPATMAVVCFRANPARWHGDLDALNRRLVEEAAATGRVYLTHTRLAGRTWMRIAVGNVLTTEPHLAEAWNVIHGLLDRVVDG